VAKARKEINWEGDSLEILSQFPDDIKSDLGYALHRLQIGQLPAQSRPMKSIGAGVYELKESDERAWYRVIYFAKVADRIYVLHCFEKKSAKTSPVDLNVAKKRLKQVNERLREEAKYEKK
jgi:phage-related protein